MSGSGLIAGYLGALSRQLPGHVVEELADGLEETYRRHLSLGLAPEAAARAATAEAAPTRAAGLSAYADATVLAHRKLLPGALSAADGRAAGLHTAVRHERVLSAVGTVVAILLGLALLGLAVLALLISRRLGGRKIIAVLVTLAVAGASVTILQLGDEIPFAVGAVQRPHLR